jgi:hypothetical protein
MRKSWSVVVVAGMSLGAGCLDPGSEEQEETGSSGLAASVTWTNVVRVTAAGNDLTKNDPGGTWNAGAVSVEELAGDGHVEFTTGEASTTKMCGLGNGDAGQGYVDIEFGIRLKANGGIAVYESGTQRGSGFGTYAAGDVFRVQVEGGVVSYRKNGVVFYTSALWASFPLRVDTSLLTDGATISDVALTPTSLTWQNVVGLAIAGRTLTKTGATGWNAGASSVETLAGDGFVEFTSDESNRGKMAGLSDGDSDQSQADIDYAVYLRANGVAAIYEGGVARDSNVGTYAAGDIFRVEVAGGVVRYSKNGGAPLYTSSVAATGPLGIDTAFNTTGATLRDFALTDAADACPVYDGGGTVCGGSFTVANDADLAAIAGCAQITGNLTITAPGLTTIALRNLERVGGNLVVMGNTTLVKLLLAQLKEVGGMLRLELGSSTTQVDLSRLRSSGSLVSGMAPAALRMSCLTTTGGDVDVPMLVAPNLTSIGGVLWFVAGMDFPLLEQAGGILVGSSFSRPWTSPDVSLPSLHTVTGIFATAVRSLGVDTEGTYVFNCRSDSPGPYTLSVPALERVGSLTVCHLPDNGLDLAQLRSVTGPPTPIESERDKPGILIRNPADTSTEITLPVLEEMVGTLEISLPAHLPSLIRAGSIDVWNTIDAPALEEINGRATIRLTTALPSLTRIDGSLDIRGVFTAPALQEVTRNLTYVGGSLTADDLATVGGALLIKKTVTAVSLPALSSVDSIRVANSNDNSLQTLSLPSLTTVTGADGTFYSGLLELSGTRLTTLSLPALSTVEGDFRLSRNHVLTSFDIPLLTSVGPSLTITSNEDLPNCYATDLLAQLQAAGWSGTSTISGNGSGSCP